MYKMCPIFGLVPSSISVWLDFGLEVMTKVVLSNCIRDMRIEWTSDEEMNHSANLLKKQ